MAMLLVVPGKEDLAVGPGGLDRGELAGEVGPVLQGLELRLGVRVVVGDVRAAMRLGVTEEPRSAWMLSWSRPMPCLATVWRISTPASAADSRLATIHPDHVAGEDV